MSETIKTKPVRRIELKVRPDIRENATAASGISASSGNKFDPAQTVQTPDDPVTGSPADTSDQKRSAPKAVGSGEHNAMSQLLNIEREVRQSGSEAELRFLMVNSTRGIVNYRQAFLLLKKGEKNYVTIAVSSLSAVDRNSTFIRWIEENVDASLKKNGDEEVALVNVELQGNSIDVEAKVYPFGNFVLLPMKLRDGTVFAQLVMSRETPWLKSDVTAAGRLVETYSHAWQALAGPRQLKKRMRNKTLTAILAGVAIAAAGFLPIPLTVLAPAEITAADPVVIAAPMDAVVENVEVLPNTLVKKGDLLFRFNDTDLRNRFDVAGQSVEVAEARYSQAQRNSFSDPRAKRDLAIALSELKLKAAEYDYARDLLALTEVRAPRDGLIIFANKDEFTGKPVSTGERIMRIADPSNVELTIDLAVADSIVLENRARVRLFMDSAPLNPVEARLESASYHARPDKDGVLSYRVVAKFYNEGEMAIPRIGLRGTAQIHGEEVPLAFYIFRKPLSVARQWIGF